MADTAFWIWLQTALGAGNRKVDRVIGEGISPELLYRMGAAEREKTGLFAVSEQKALNAVTLKDAEKTLGKAKEQGWQVLTPEHPHFPENLTHIVSAPCVLYVLGDLSTLADELLVAMVGTRGSTQDGEQAAFLLARDLAAAGCTVVSGLAVGIDCAAHEGALSMNARTIGFLGCGLDVDYPAKCAGLKKRILQHNGVLISEFAPGLRAFPQHFPIRNRLLSGICAGAVVVQAPRSSGALNTAGHALEQGRDVFAVPGGIFDQKYAGCNQLIKEGAKIVLNGYSILEEYIGRFPASIDPRQVKPKIHEANRIWNDQKRKREEKEAQAEIGRKASEQEQQLERMKLSENARKIYEVLCFEPADCCTIAQRTGLLIMDLMAGATELELLGLAESLPGSRYAAVSKKT